MYFSTRYRRAAKYYSSSRSYFFDMKKSRSSSDAIARYWSVSKSKSYRKALSYSDSCASSRAMSGEY